MGGRLIIPIVNGMPPLIVDMWDPRDMPSITPGCSGGRRRKKPKDYKKARAKAKKVAKASKKKNR